MDLSRQVWKSIALKHASLKFDKREAEIQYQHQTDDLKKLKSTISESDSKNNKLKSEIKTQIKYSESVKSSVVLLKSSEKSLMKEKNDLLKQLELQRIKIDEEKKERDAILSKYRIMWDQLLSGFHEIPLVKKKLNLEVENKKLEIELREKKKDLRSLKSKMKQFVEINERRFQINFIKFADAWVNKREELLRNKEIQEQSHKRNEELLQKTERSKESHTTTSTVMNTDENTLQTTTAVDTVDNMLINLHDLSFSSFASNEEEGFSKLKELQKELSMDNLLNARFLTLCESNSGNDHASLKHKNTLNESSKIPVLNKIDHKQAAEKNLNSVSNCVADNAKKMNHINNIHNSLKPSKIVSPGNSRIPVVISPICKEREVLVPENTKNSWTRRINTYSSPQSSQNCAHFSPRVTSAKNPINFPKPNFGNRGALKRQLENPSLASPRVLQKVSRSENNSISCSDPRKKFKVEQIKQRDTSNSKIDMVESKRKGIENLGNVEPQKVIRNEERSIVEDDENNMLVDGLNRTRDDLNETYTLEESTMIHREEQREHYETEKDMEAFNIDAAEVPEDDGAVSKYFQETHDDKENTPPQDTIPDMDLENAGNFEEMLQDIRNTSHDEENEFIGNFYTSPPQVSQFSPTGQVQDPSGDDFELFAKESGKVTSSPTREENTEDNFSSKGFSLFFRSQSRAQSKKPESKRFF